MISKQVNTYFASLKELLSKNISRVPLIIPDYQRPYTWNSKNVIQLLEDIVRFSKYPEYRIGTIILHKNGDTLDIVDGQQRIVTSLLIAKCLTEEAQEELISLEIPEHPKTIKHIVENFNIISKYFERNPKNKEIINNFFLSNCTIQVLILENIDEAFQLFDSSNNRGKALYPTDLLKAFHLREIHGNDEKKLEMAELWENIKPNHIHILFSEYLYRIKKWSKNKDVSASGFSNYDIDLFKGISEGNRNDGLNWAKPILMAKNFVDNFNSQNQAMIDFNILPKMNYAFQIDQPIINGEYFFKYVAHYNSLLDKHGFYSDVENENSILSLYVNKSDWSYFKYVQSLFKTSMLYALDKFSDSDYELFKNVCFKYSYFPRFYLEQVQEKSINKFVVRNDTGINNLFSYISQSFSSNDLTHFQIPIHKERLKNVDRVKNKSEELVTEYFRGEN